METIVGSATIISKTLHISKCYKCNY